MFGLSFMEIVVLLLVAVVVIGPRQLPTMLRTAGKWVTKLRRMAFDMREQSGIDDVLRNEGLEQDIRQLRALMRKGNVLDALAIDVDAEIARGARPKPVRAEGTVSPQDDDIDISDREYPTAGADAYGLSTEDIDPYQQNQGEGGEEAGKESVDGASDGTGVSLDEKDEATTETSKTNEPATNRADG